MATTIVYRLYAFVHRFASSESSRRIRDRVLEWSQQRNIAVKIEIIGYAVYVEFPDEESLTLYCLTVEDIPQTFQRVDSIPE